MAQYTNRRRTFLNNSGTAVLRLGYDATNYADFIPDSSGNISVPEVRKWLLGDTANAKMTAGLTLNQGTADDEILALKSSDVAHGVTDKAETDTYATFSKAGFTDGGAILHGFTGAKIATRLNGTVTTADTARTASAFGAVEVSSRLKSGTGETSLSTNANLFVVRNLGDSRWLVDAEGDTHADALHNDNAWDEHDDVALLSTFRATQMRDRSTARRIFGQWATDEHNKQILHDTGVITVTPREDGTEEVWYSQKGVLALLMDAVRQVGERVDRVAVHAGMDPAKLREAA